jgi:hypothetical protein
VELGVRFPSRRSRIELDWVPNIEQKYNLIPSEYLQIFLGIYVMSHQDTQDLVFEPERGIEEE